MKKNFLISTGYSRVRVDPHITQLEKIFAKNGPNLILIGVNVVNLGHFVEQFFGPRIIQIEKILEKFCPKFLNLHVSIYGTMG